MSPASWLLWTAVQAGAPGSRAAEPAAPGTRKRTPLEKRVLDHCRFEPKGEGRVPMRLAEDESGDHRPILINIQVEDSTKADELTALFRKAIVAVHGELHPGSTIADDALIAPPTEQAIAALRDDIDALLMELPNQLREELEPRDDTGRRDLLKGIVDGTQTTRRYGWGAGPEVSRISSTLLERLAALAAQKEVLASRPAVDILQIDLDRPSDARTEELTVRHLIGGRIGEFSMQLKTIDPGDAQLRYDTDQEDLYDRLRRLLGSPGAPSGRVVSVTAASGEHRIPRIDAPELTVRAGTLTLTAEGQSDRNTALQYCWLIDPRAPGEGVAPSRRTRETPEPWTAPSVEPTLSVDLPMGVLPSRPTSWRVRVVAWDGTQLSQASAPVDLEVVPNYLATHDAIRVSMARRPVLMPLGRQGRSPAHLMVMQAEVAPWAPPLRYTWDLPANIPCRAVVGTDANHCTTTTSGTLAITRVPFLGVEHTQSDLLHTAVVAEDRTPGVSVRSEPVQLTTARQHAYSSSRFPWEVSSAFEFRGLTEKVSGDQKRRMLMTPAVTIGVGSGGVALESGVFTTYRPSEGEARHLGWHVGLSALARTTMSSIADAAYGYDRQRLAPLDDGVMVDVYGRLSYWNHTRPGVGSPRARTIDPMDTRVRHSVHLEVGPQVRVGRWIGTTTVFGLRSFTEDDAGEALRNPLGASFSIGWRSAASRSRMDQLDGRGSLPPSVGSDPTLRPCRRARSPRNSWRCHDTILAVHTKNKPVVARLEELDEDTVGLVQSEAHVSTDERWTHRLLVVLSEQSAEALGARVGDAKSITAAQDALMDALQIQTQRWIADHMVHPRQTRWHVQLARLLQGTWTPHLPEPPTPDPTPAPPESSTDGPPLQPAPAQRWLDLKSEHQDTLGRIQLTVTCMVKEPAHCEIGFEIDIQVEDRAMLNRVGARQLDQTLAPYVVAAWKQAVRRQR